MLSALYIEMVGSTYTATVSREKVWFNEIEHGVGNKHEICSDDILQSAYEH